MEKDRGRGKDRWKKIEGEGKIDRGRKRGRERGGWREGERWER